MRQASLRGQFNPVLWMDVLLWPRQTKKAPPFWLDYCEHWTEFHALPKGLHGR